MLLATGELRRTRTRFALLGAGAALLVFVLLFQQLLLGGVLGGMTGALGAQSGEVVVFATDARRSAVGSLVLPDQVEAIRSQTGVAAVGEIGVTSLALDAGSQVLEASVFGFRPGAPGEPTTVVEGRLPTAAGEALASREDAAGNYSVGATVTLEPGGSEVEIVGLTEGARYNVVPTVWLTWAGYVEVLQAANPDAAAILPSILAVTPDADVAPGELAASLSANLDGLEAVTRSEAVNDAPGIGAVRVAFGMVLFLGYLVVGLVIGFFFLTLTLQKASSVALLRATGAPTRYLVGSLAQQVLTIMAIAVVGGILLLAGLLPLVQTGVPVDADPATIGASIVGVLVVASIGAIASARRIAAADPFSAVGRAHLGGLT